MIVVADSSPLRYLIVIRQQALLPLLFGSVQIPSVVLAELTTAATPAMVRDVLTSRPDWLIVSDPDPERTLGLLRVAAEKGLINVNSLVANLRSCGLYLDERLIMKTFGQWL